MQDRGVSGSAAGGVTLLDGAALVIGAAVAAFHVREAVTQIPHGGGWVLLWATFLWLAVTAAGPFVFLGRWWGRRPPGYPRVGDQLWALLGLPWVVTALVGTIAPPSRVDRIDLYTFVLGLGLAAACALALLVVWTTWVTVPPEQAERTETGPWTNRVGLVLAVAWPVQCGFGLMIIGSIGY